MTCPACTTAQTVKHCGLYVARCSGCQARALASGMLFFESRRRGQLLQAYQTALRSVYGDDGWRAGHEAVKAEAKRMAAM